MPRVPACENQAGPGVELMPENGGKACSETFRYVPVRCSANERRVNFSALRTNANGAYAGHG